MKILITGCSGTIGGNVLRSGIFDHDEIYCTVRSDEGKKGAPANAVFINCDIVKDDYEKLLPQKIDVILHAAAMAPKSAKKPEDYLQNIYLAEKITDYAMKAKAKQVVFFSSGSVYGEGGKKHNETDAPNPSDDYGKSMTASEKIFLQSNIPATILRLFYPYGFDEYTSATNFMAKLFLKILRNEEITIGETATQNKFNPALIADVNKIVKWLLENHWTGTLNIAGSDELTLKEFLLTTGRLLNHAPKIISNAGIPAPLTADIQLLKSLPLGFELTSLEKGIHLTIQRINNSFAG